MLTADGVSLDSTLQCFRDVCRGEDIGPGMLRRVMPCDVPGVVSDVASGAVSSVATVAVVPCRAVSFPAACFLRIILACCGFVRGCFGAESGAGTEMPARFVFVTF